MRKPPKKIPRASPPNHLSTEGKALWTRLCRAFVLDDPGGLAMLRLACESFDRAERARKLIDADGEVITDRFDQKRVHPAAAVERDARSQMLAALKALKLDGGAEA